MAIEVFNRYEKKFMLNCDVYWKIQKLLCEYMELDEYNKTHSYYTIANIYYDTSDNHLIRTSLSKPKYKEKLRLRAYGVPSMDDKVYLEIKKKVNGLVNKRRTKLVLREAYDFIETQKKPDLKPYMNKQVLNEIDYFLKVYDLEPKLYLAYDRKAFFGINNRDLRITFDANIRTRRYDLRLECGDYGERLIDNSYVLMEVKAEKSIPIWLSKMLSENKLYTVSFSKYGTEYHNMIRNNIEMNSQIIDQYLIPEQIQQNYKSEINF